MDHFNSTVRDGELVNTRRGLQVSRQKFNGLSFVNAYPQQPAATVPASKSSTSPDKVAKLPQRQFKFIDTGSSVSSRQGTPRPHRQDSESLSSNFEFSSDAAAGGKKPLRRRVTPKDATTTASSASSPSRRSSHASSNASSSMGDGQTPKSQQDTYSSSSTAATTSAAWQPIRELPADMSEENWRLFHHYFAGVPSKMYPYEEILAHNPVRSSDFYEMHVRDPAAVQIVLMCGSIGVAVMNKERNPKGLAYYISTICSILNRKLDQQKKAVDDVTLLCITALAAASCYVGRLDHWHMHMRGLQKALDVSSQGLDGLPPWLLAKIHTTDLEGAAALASTPYLAFTRRYEPISTILPLPVRNQICASLSSLLGPLHIDAAVIGSLSALSLLWSSVGFARSSSGAVVFDPHAFTDELLAMKHSLVTQPSPLQQAESGRPHALSNPYEIPGSADSTASSSNSKAGSGNEIYMGSHRLRSSARIIPSRLGLGGPLEPALRISGLLYLKELLPTWPRNFGGYAVLLELLVGHLRTLLDEYLMRGEEGGGFDSRLVDPLITGSAPRDGGNQQKKNVVGGTSGGSGRKKTGSGQRNSSAATSKGKTTTTTSSQQNQQPAARETIRPVVLWICVLGDMVSRIADENEDRRGRRRRYNQDDADEQQRQSDEDDSEDDYVDEKEVDVYPKEIYQECLREIVGLESVEDVDKLLGQQQNEELVMFGLFDMGMIASSSRRVNAAELRGGSDGDSIMAGSGEQQQWMEEDETKEGDGWDLRDALVRIVGGD
ncbi:hypothetical protein B0H66DRAFT_351686 [Apodospora peruviana]|uniref:Uncharacterized protein n=1 Tax=Apodospora peruviana TaxID=516989 RepID=A0AAE0LZ95_9PEZI|nr:hypothetical protein B0H66DRAFT_351686 [Apodospora peruviana]